MSLSLSLSLSLSFYYVRDFYRSAKWSERVVSVAPSPGPKWVEREDTGVAIITLVRRYQSFAVEVGPNFDIHQHCLSMR